MWMFFRLLSNPPEHIALFYTQFSTTRMFIVLPALASPDAGWAQFSHVAPVRTDVGVNDMRAIQWPSCNITSGFCVSVDWHLL